MNIVLVRPWRNHPAGTELQSVSPDIAKQIVHDGCAVVAVKEESDPKVERKALYQPPASKMVKSPPETK